MSKTFIKDMSEFYNKFEMNKVVKGMSKQELRDFLEFRIDLLVEEYTELVSNPNNPEEIVDALIDIVVVALGTLNCFDIDIEKAWNEVLKANMSKEFGKKEGRPNPLGLPDLMKPEGWQSPSHIDNHGLLSQMNDKV